MGDLVGDCVEGVREVNVGLYVGVGMPEWGNFDGVWHLVGGEAFRLVGGLGGPFSSSRQARCASVGRVLRWARVAPTGFAHAHAACHFCCTDRTRDARGEQRGRDTIARHARCARSERSAGRVACRGLDASRATFAKRLRQAERSFTMSLGPASRATTSHPARPTCPPGALDPMAKRYFEQGLALAYGFNHRAAIRSFRQAQALAPDCALCFWGEALANGPNINAGMDDAGNRAALAALERAGRWRRSRRRWCRLWSPRRRRATRPRPTPTGPRSTRPTPTRCSRSPADHADSDDVAILATEAAMNTTPMELLRPRDW